MRWLGRGLLLAITTVSVGLWITVMTLQSTLLNREVVLGWLDKSGAYNHVLDSIINLQNVGQGAQSLDQQALQKAVGETLTPSYIKQVSETAINSVFDWLEGKTDEISFNITVADKRAELQQQLQEVLVPQLKGLPVCKSGFSGLSSSDNECLPQGANAEQVANNAAKQAIEGSDFLTEPITEESISQTGLQNMTWLPATVQSMGMLSLLLPAVALLSGLGYILLNQSRLAGCRALAGHLFFGTAITALMGMALWYFGGNVQIDQSSVGEDQVPLVRDVIQPIIYQVAPSIGSWLALLAGSIAAVCSVTWLALFFVGRKHGSQVAQGEPKSLPKPEPPKEPEHKQPEPAPTPAAPTQPVPVQAAPPAPKPPVRTIGRM